MPAAVLNGKEKAGRIKQDLSREIEVLKSSAGSVPKLAALQVSDGGAFSVYANSQKKIASVIGMEYELIRVDKPVIEENLTAKIGELNADDSINGIILQSPLPGGFDIVKAASFISADKDVEGVNPENKGKLLLNAYQVIPPTASAAMELIAMCVDDIYGKEAVVIGHSAIVGKPLSMLLLDKFATVTVCHVATSKMNKLAEHVRKADILISAVGKPNLIKGEWIKQGAVVIDVGINRVGGKITGDVEFEKAGENASYISPVPGGVGPLTTAILMRNCVELFKKQKGIA